jgi:hypothetical protein
MWLTKPQDNVVSNDPYEQGEYIFWDVNMWAKTKVPSPPTSVAFTDVAAKVFLVI